MMPFDGRSGFDDAPTTAMVEAERESWRISASGGLLCATRRSQPRGRGRCDARPLTAFTVQLAGI